VVAFCWSSLARLECDGGFRFDLNNAATHRNTRSRGVCVSSFDRGQLSVDLHIMLCVCIGEADCL
jgi:hypothetical protein